MITDIAIEDYQALRKAQLRLGRLTVVTGPTGSGKSAVVRALKLVVFNARGTAYIRHGAKSCKAIVQDDSGLTAGIVRGGRGQDAYTVNVLGEKKTYTKLAGAVPEEVSALLALQDINFAGQFDRPFLLADSGSQVARALGELTNVTLVFDAAREANRRKLEIARELKSYEDMVRALTAAAQPFRTLKARRAAFMEARDRMDSLEYITDQRERLGALWSAFRQGIAAQSAAETRLAVLSAPSAEQLDLLGSRLGRLRNLHSQYQQADQAARTTERQQQILAVEEDKAHRALHEALVAAGTCPTCGQSVGEGTS